MYRPILALAAGIVGLILSVKGQKIEVKKNMATAGLTLSIVGLSILALKAFYVLYGLLAVLTAASVIF